MPITDKRVFELADSCMTQYTLPSGQIGWDSDDSDLLAFARALLAEHEARLLRLGTQALQECGGVGVVG